MDIVKDMAANLKLLQRQVDASLDLVKCENINKLYVNTLHEAGCTYSVDALAWIFASALVISVCGLIMIMLRSSYYPVEYLDLDESWDDLGTKPTKSASKDSVESIDPAASKRSAHKAVPVIVSQAGDEEEFEFRLPPDGEEF